MVTYEWDVEFWDGEEIVDHNYADRLKDSVSDLSIIDGVAVRLVLTRMVWNKYDSLEHQEWAYAAFDGGRLSLPEDLSDAFGRPGHRVPKKYHKELEREVDIMIRVKKMDHQSQAKIGHNYGQ